MEQTTTITFAEAVRLAIKRSGMTLEELGERAQVHPKTLGRWQNGKTMPAFDDVIRFAEATGQPISLFVSAVATVSGQHHRRNDWYAPVVDITQHHDHSSWPIPGQQTLLQSVAA